MSSPPIAPSERFVSIIVPTYKEVLNLRELSKQINTVLSNNNITYEIIFVDDNSQDGSIDVVDQQIVQEDKIPASIIVRTHERGLSSAVLRGFEAAKYETLLVMDADLQHNPIYLPSLINPIITGEADFSVGSRHTAGGGIEDWAFHRKLISWGATLIARPLVPSTDPMSGFFALSKTTLNRAKVLNPLGYKIGLELMVRCDVQAGRLNEVPIIFKDRQLGESKLNIKTNALYLLHVSQLYLDCKPHYVFVVAVCLFIVMLVIGRKVLFSSQNNMNYTNNQVDSRVAAQLVGGNGPREAIAKTSSAAFSFDDNDQVYDDDDVKSTRDKKHTTTRNEQEKDENETTTTHTTRSSARKAKKVD